MVLEDGIGVERILVLTFTKAATEELRERIASRLRAALAAVDGAEIADPILEQILRPLDTKIAQVRLAEAVSHMDEAAIHTIHAFCQRLLRDNAFESGISFEPEMIQDESELRRLAAEDLWRRHMAKADSEQAAWMLSNWPNGPAQLLATLGAYIGAAEFEVIPAQIHLQMHLQRRPRTRTHRPPMMIQWHRRAPGASACAAPGRQPATRSSQ